MNRKHWSMTWYVKRSRDTKELTSIRESSLRRFSKSKIKCAKKETRYSSSWNTATSKLLKWNASLQTLTYKKSKSRLNCSEKTSDFANPRWPLSKSRRSSSLQTRPKTTLEPLRHRWQRHHALLWSATIPMKSLRWYQQTKWKWKTQRALLSVNLSTRSVNSRLYRLSNPHSKQLQKGTIPKSKLKIQVSCLVTKAKKLRGDMFQKPIQCRRKISTRVMVLENERAPNVR